MSNGRMQYERKAAGKLILKNICMKTVNSYYKKKTICETFKNHALKIMVTHTVRLRAMRNTKKKT